MIVQIQTTDNKTTLELWDAEGAPLEAYVRIKNDDMKSFPKPLIFLKKDLIKAISVFNSLAYR